MGADALQLILLAVAIAALVLVVVARTKGWRIPEPLVVAAGFLAALVAAVAGLWPSRGGRHGQGPRTPPGGPVEPLEPPDVSPVTDVARDVIEREADEALVDTELAHEDDGDLGAVDAGRSRRRRRR